MRNAYSIPSLIGHRAHFTGEPLCPARTRGQAGHRMIATCDLLRPGSESLNTDRTRRRRQARFRTQPGHPCPVRVEPPFRSVKIGNSRTRQPGAIHIALNWPHATRALMHAQREWFLLNSTATVAHLGQPQRGREVIGLNASICGFALKQAHKPGRRGQPNRLAKVALERAIRVLFNPNIVAQLKDLKLRYSELLQPSGADKFIALSELQL